MTSSDQARTLQTTRTQRIAVSKTAGMRVLTTLLPARIRADEDYKMA